MKGLKEKRLEAKLTQRELAEKLNLHLRAYLNYEYGQREPKFEILKRMAKFFNCTIDELL